MGCCKCEEYNWPDPQVVVWKDPADEKEYCVFHAPREQKWKGRSGKNKYSLKDFNHAVYLRIDSILQSNDREPEEKYCAFMGAIFPGEISFSAIYSGALLPNMDFSHAMFYGDVNFSLVKFSGAVIFENTTFNSHVSFFRAEFYGAVLFNWTVFNGIATLTGAGFYSNIQFLDCEARDKHIRLQRIKPLSMRKVLLHPMDLDKFSFEFSQWTSSVNGTENLFRALKQRAIAECDQLHISKWSFHEKLMRLRDMLEPAGHNRLIDAFEDDCLCDRNRIQALWELFRALPWEKRRSLLYLYWICSGFGERPRRALACLVSLAALPLLLLIPLKLFETGLSLQPDIVKTAEVFAEWVRCMPLVKLEATVTPTAPLVSVFRAGLSWIFQVAIALQATLFALAVRNRFRR